MSHTPLEVIMIGESKLEGKNEIKDFLGWSMSKLNRKKNQMIRKNVLFYEYIGRPPVKKLCGFREKLTDFVSGGTR